MLAGRFPKSKLHIGLLKVRTGGPKANHTRPLIMSMVNTKNMLKWGLGMSPETPKCLLAKYEGYEY